MDGCFVVILPVSMNREHAKFRFESFQQTQKNFTIYCETRSQRNVVITGIVAAPPYLDVVDI
jgi:hypothetical protein